jgi:hypothetical protein
VREQANIAAVPPFRHDMPSWLPRDVMVNARAGAKPSKTTRDHRQATTVAALTGRGLYINYYIDI